MWSTLYDLWSILAKNIKPALFKEYRRSRVQFKPQEEQTVDKIQNVGYSTRPLAWSLQKVNVISLSIYTHLFHMRMRACAHTRELH